MPIYEYRHVDKPEKCREIFEIIEISPKDSIRKCPDCGRPVERILSKFSSHENILATSNLKDKGFTKMVKDNEKGGYRKVV